MGSSTDRTHRLIRDHLMKSLHKTIPDLIEPVIFFGGLQFICADTFHDGFVGERTLAGEHQGCAANILRQPFSVNCACITCDPKLQRHYFGVDERRYTRILSDPNETSLCLNCQNAIHPEALEEYRDIRINPIIDTPQDMAQGEEFDGHEFDDPDGIGLCATCGIDEGNHP